MKFKIAERYFPPTKQLTDKQARKLLQTDYSEAVDAQPIYRGIYGGGSDYTGPILVTPDPKIERKSMNTALNFYTLFINHSPAWKNFPKRQTICSTDIDRVRDGYSIEAKDVFRVYPKNGAKIGICPEEDIWDSGFNEYNNTLETIFSFAERLKKIKKKTDWFAPNITWNKIIKACEIVDSVKDIIANSPKIKADLIYMLDYDSHIDDYLHFNIPFLKFITTHLFSPYEFGVKHIKNFSASNNVEVWTDAPTLMMPVWNQEE